MMSDNPTPSRLRVTAAALAAGLVAALLVVVPTTGADAAGASNDGYWLLESDGDVYGFGGAGDLGSGTGTTHVDIEGNPTGDGYWVVDRNGRVDAFGVATDLGDLASAAVSLTPGETAVSLSSTASGNGYWIFTSRGRAVAFGDAAALGDLIALTLNAPIIDSVATVDGTGYWLVAGDGGVFGFGTAGFHGSMGGIPLNQPVVGLAPTSNGKGYWLVASDGGVFAFGNAGFRGSMGGQPLNQPVVGLVPYGNGYFLVAADGGVFVFSNLGFEGSLGNNPPNSPIVSATARRTVPVEDRVLALGDSITKGGLKGADPDGGGPQVAPLLNRSYRDKLEHLFDDNQCLVDFVGPYNGPSHPSQTWLDGDHGAINGERADQMLTRVQDHSWLTGARPNIVLLHVGTNDLLGTNLGTPRTPAATAADTRAIIEELQTARPGVEVVLAKIFPSEPTGGNAGVAATFATYNTLLAGVASATGAHLVDMNTGFSARPYWENPSGDTLEWIHPNQAAENAMADRWWAKLNADDLLGGC